MSSYWLVYVRDWYIIITCITVPLLPIPIPIHTSYIKKSISYPQTSSYPDLYIGIHIFICTGNKKVWIREHISPNENTLLSIYPKHSRYMYVWWETSRFRYNPPSVFVFFIILFYHVRVWPQDPIC